MSDPSAATPSPAPGPRPKYKRKLSNYLLDKKLQLRYVVIITLLSGLIAGTLGYMIFDQQRQSTQSIEDKLEELTDKEDAANITGDYESEDRMLVYKMVIAGFGLVVVLSLFLVVMTHRVAGPLFKTSIYFDRMAEGKLGNVSPLRQGDMLQDFFAKFKDMHDSVRSRALDDIAAMEKAVAGIREAGSKGAYRGDAHDKLVAELATFEAHIAALKKATDSHRVERPSMAPADAADQIRKAARAAVFAGAVGLVFFGIVFGTGALIRAARVKTLINRFHVGHEFMHTAKTATILGWVGIALWAVGMVAAFVMLS